MTRCLCLVACFAFTRTGASVQAQVRPLGDFQPAVHFPPGTGTVAAVAIGDFDGDREPDPLLERLLEPQGWPPRGGLCLPGA